MRSQELTKHFDIFDLGTLFWKTHIQKIDQDEDFQRIKPSSVTARDKVNEVYKFLNICFNLSEH